MALKLLSLQLFLLLALIAPHAITSRHLHTHKSSRFQFSQSLEAEGTRKGNNNIIQGINDVRLYLQRYGYLTNEKNNNNLNKAFDDDLESAIKTFQKFFKLNASGILDKETLTLMSKSRCGVPDIITNNGSSNDFHSYFRVFPGGAKWPVTKFHLTYEFHKSFPKEFEAPVVSAMEQWASVSKFTFSPSTSWFTSADIKLSFERGDHGDNYPFDGKGGELAHAFGPMDARVHFDADDSFSIGNVAGLYNVGMVALHELGHVLGLGHSEVPEAVMWPSMLTDYSKPLHFDDMQGIQTIYG